MLIAFAPHVLIVVIALFMLRLFGQGMMTHIAYTEIGRWFVASRGRAISLVVPGHQAGEAILPVLFVLASAAFGWQTAWVAAGATILLLGYPAILVLLRTERIPLHQAGSVDVAQTVKDWTRAEVVRDPVFYLLMIGVLAPPFIGTTIFFHQGYLIELRGYNALAFAAAFPVMAITTVAFALISGALIDRYSATRILPFFLIPMVVATLAAALVTPVWGIYLFMFLFGISYGFTSTLLGALWPEVYGLAHLGGIRALTVSAMVLATALGPGITGALIDLGIGLPQQLLWMALWCVAASVALGFATRRITARQRA